MTSKLKILLLIAVILVGILPASSGAGPVAVGPCYQGFARALNDLERGTRRVSVIDGSEIINIHAYVNAPKLNKKRNSYNASRYTRMKSHTLTLEGRTIRYDFSGNYFRLQKGKFTGGISLKFISRDQQFIDWNGKIINTDGLEDNPQLLDELMKKSHWNAIRK